MPSYKIHSIKDSEKLSFIIEWDVESSISQKLSGEWHIILSIEKIEAPTENLFCFEGKTPTGEFIDGKISADDIFLAFEMLKKEYKYSITKLHPENIHDPQKQEKIFQNLSNTFEENTIEKPKKTADTSEKHLHEYKKTLQKLIDILQKETIPGWATTILELKKLDQNNNLSTIQQSLKEIVKKLSKNRQNKTLFDKLKPVRKELGVYVLPNIVLSFLKKTQNMSGFLAPIIHSQEKNIPKHSHETTQEAIKNEYTAIQNNTHINTFLRKKYRPTISYLFRPGWKLYYIYTLLRQKKLLFVSSQAVSWIKKVLIIALLTTCFLLATATFFGLYTTIFVTTNTIYIFLGFIIVSLVIQSEAV